MALIETLELSDAKDRLRSLIEDRTILAERVTAALAAKAQSLGDDDAELVNVLWVLMPGVTTSTRSVLKLTSDFDMSIRDCFGIARSIFEGSLNVAYIAAVGAPAALKARRHSKQKAYRDLSRPEIIELKIDRSTLPSAHEIEGMAEALDEFTGRKGAELTDWAGIGVREKMNAVFEHYPGAKLGMSVAADTIYRPASEVLHGTFSGVEFFWEPRQNAEGRLLPFEGQYVYEFLMKIFMTIFGAVGCMLEIVAEEQSVVGVIDQLKAGWVEAAALVGSPTEV